MKLAFLNTYGNGSTGKIVDELKKISLKNGFEVRSYYSREYCSTPDTSKKVFKKIGFYFDAIMSRLFDNHGRNSYINTYSLIRDLKSFNPDIIHIHNLHGYWINYTMLFKYIKKNNIKVIFTLHDCWAFTGHCVHFDFIGCDKWKNICFDCPQKKLYPKSAFFDMSRNNYKKKKKIFTSISHDNMIIVTPSDWLKRKVSESFLNKYECLVINNGIDTSVFKPTDSIIREKYGLCNKIVVLAVANYWDERKGLSFIFDCAKIRNDWFFVYIGREKTKNDLLLNNIIHIDRTESKEELAEWYSLCDVYFNPTLEDNYPTTNLEAIACGAPVVTFDTGGSPEIVYETGYGIICEKKDAQSAISSIEYIITKKVKKDYDFSKILDSKSKFGPLYISLYKKILKER